jgi:hypothetical protein
MTWFAAAPIFVQIFGDVKSPISVQLGTVTHQINIGLPFSWWVLWIASLLYVAAYALFSFYCPAFIKRYRGYSDYAAVGHSPRYLAHELKRAFDASSNRQQLITRLEVKGFSHPTDRSLPPENPSIETDATTFFYELDGGKMQVPIGSDTTDERQRELFWEIFEPFANAYFWPRAIIKGLFLSSISLVVYVVSQQIYSVAKFAYDAL